MDFESMQLLRKSDYEIKKLPDIIFYITDEYYKIIDIKDWLLISYKTMSFVPINSKDYVYNAIIINYDKYDNTYSIKDNKEKNNAKRVLVVKEGYCRNLRTIKREFEYNHTRDIRLGIISTTKIFKKLKLLYEKLGWSSKLGEKMHTFCIEYIPKAGEELAIGILGLLTFSQRSAGD